MKIWWHKLNYWKKGAFLGLAFWLLAILLFVIAIVLGELKVLGLDELIGKISVYILIMPIRILRIPIGVGDDIGVAFLFLLISAVISMFSYPIFGALIGSVMGRLKKSDLDK